MADIGAVRQHLLPRFDGRGSAPPLRSELPPTLSAGRLQPVTSLSGAAGDWPTFSFMALIIFYIVYHRYPK